MVVAIAINSDGEVNNNHFGDAMGFLIYDVSALKCDFKCEIANELKDFDEEHGSSEKGKRIVKVLQENNVEVVVSKQFGQNIRIVSKHFIPVVTQLSAPDEFLTQWAAKGDLLTSKYLANEMNVVRV